LLLPLRHWWLKCLRLSTATHQEPGEKGYRNFHVRPGRGQAEVHIRRVRWYYQVGLIDFDRYGQRKLTYAD
jgi:hypothetical protein